MGIRIGGGQADYEYPVYMPPASEENTKENNEIFVLPSEAKEAVDFKQAVKDYKSKHLTGMTEEEWDEFWEKCRKYLDENPINNEADAATFTAFMKRLLKEYGFKGDINEICDILKLDADSLSSLEESDMSTEMKPSKTQIITEPDGTRYMIITTNSGQTMKIKIASEVEYDNHESELVNRFNGKELDNLKHNNINNNEKAIKSYERSFILIG